MKDKINICIKAAEASNDFEINNSDLKRNYLIHNITLYNDIVSKVTGTHGSFGTGYPFYALQKDLTGTLPIIKEQIRYNNELISDTLNSTYDTWPCQKCLNQNGINMPDLKKICKPCSDIDNKLKPRKVITTLPDFDMWMVCEDDLIDSAKEKLSIAFCENNIYTSDVDPIQTIYDVIEITEKIKNGIMPEKKLPIDAHIIDYSTFFSLIEQVPYILKKSSEEGKIPYLPIAPLSYRKTWQYDDSAYNFIHDYLSSLTAYNFESDLKEILTETRRIVANSYTFEELYSYLLSTGPDSVKRRHKTLELKNRFRERVESWKK